MITRTKIATGSISLAHSSIACCYPQAILLAIAASASFTYGEEQISCLEDLGGQHKKYMFSNHPLQQNELLFSKIVCKLSVLVCKFSVQTAQEKTWMSKKHKMIFEYKLLNSKSEVRNKNLSHCRKIFQLSRWDENVTETTSQWMISQGKFITV